mmetsp:Transcript_10968/g.16341  ORF Transcript_10968/g.16341 Transcript_10968/m.16341 type:complete len:211 (+) Transcript_10968:6-638(+)
MSRLQQRIDDAFDRHIERMTMARMAKNKIGAWRLPIKKDRKPRSSTTSKCSCHLELMPCTPKLEEESSSLDLHINEVSVITEDIEEAVPTSVTEVEPISPDFNSASAIIVNTSAILVNTLTANDATISYFEEISFMRNDKNFATKMNGFKYVRCFSSIFEYGKLNAFPNYYTTDNRLKLTLAERKILKIIMNFIKWLFDFYALEKDEVCS